MNTWIKTKCPNTEMLWIHELKQNVQILRCCTAIHFLFFKLFFWHSLIDIGVPKPLPTPPPLFSSPGFQWVVCTSSFHTENDYIKCRERHRGNYKLLSYNSVLSTYWDYTQTNPGYCIVHLYVTFKFWLNILSIKL